VELSWGHGVGCGPWISMDAACDQPLATRPQAANSAVTPIGLFVGEER
jgi:hypothetical protein